MVVYIASDNVLPIISWNEESPSFYVSENSEDEKRVEIQFTKPFIYFVGSHQGCGCGFQYGLLPTESDEDSQEYESSREAVNKFSRYLSDALQNGPIELYACWDGDQDAEPVSRRVITPSEIGGEIFQFIDKEFLVVTKDLLE